jgi:hypothetical protein
MVKLQKAVTVCMNIAFSLAIHLVVVKGDYLEMNLKIPHELLPKV